MSHRELLKEPAKRRKAYLTELYFNLTESGDFAQLLLIAAEDNEDYAGDRECQDKKKYLSAAKYLKAAAKKES